MDTLETIKLLKQNNLLRTIEEKLDINLEIPHVAYIEAKKENPKALLFTNPVDKKRDKIFDIPVLMNIFCSEKAVELFIGDVNGIAKEIENLLHFKQPESLGEKFSILKNFFSLKSVFPKRLKRRGLCQEIVKTGEKVNLRELPILTTWEKDGGPFITTGQVFTMSLNGDMNNLGMYRLQLHNEKCLGMHWQIHKDGAHFFHEYKKAGKKMPVSVAIGGDPLYIWCAQAPLPTGIFELLLYGFIKKEKAKLVKSITNNIFVPYDVDYVIEGFVDANKVKVEGPFGDHTGYYTLKTEYPFMEVTAITHKREAVYTATVVGKPPLEDKYMGYATERIFLPLLKTTAPDIIDYYMPENGVFHNLILVKISSLYPGHAKQVMHALWGTGQMSFVKHAVFVNSDAPELRNHEEISKYILERVTPENILISSGITDALDHSSDKFGTGGKLGIDCTGDKVNRKNLILLNDDELLDKFKRISREVIDLKQYFVESANPVTIITVKKERTLKEFVKSLDSIFKYIRILIILDEDKNYTDNPYMIIWRVVNNIDAERDLLIKNNIIFLDATAKNKIDGFNREWPPDVECSKEVLDDLNNRGIINIDNDFIRKFLIY